MPTVRELLTIWGFQVDERPLKQLERTLHGIKTGVKVVGAAVTGAAASLFGLAEVTRRHIDDLDEMAQAAGTNAQFLGELAAAATYGGASMEDAGNAMAFLNRSISKAKDGDEAAIASFKELGITMQDLRTLQPEAIFAGLAEGMSKTTDPSKRVALAMELLGRGGRKMLPVFKEGASGILKFANAARANGLVPSEQALKDAEAMEIAMGRAKGVVKGLTFQIGEALMPVVTDVAERFATWAKENRELIKSRIKEFVAVLTKVVRTAWTVVTKLVSAIRSLVTWFKESPVAIGIAKSVLGAFIAAMAVGKILQFIGAIKALGTIIKSVFTAAAANPLLVAFTALAIIIGEVIANWDDFVYAWGLLSTWVTANIINPLHDAWEGLKLWLKTLWSDMVRGFKDAWEGAILWFKQEVLGLKSGPMSPLTARALKIKNLGPALQAMGAQSHSPGRPGSPESGLTADALSTGLRYNPALAASMERSRGGVTVMSTIHIAVPAGMPATQVDVLESRLRRAAREEMDRAAREAALDLGL